MRITKVITAVFFAVAILSETAGQTEPNDLSAYYGFGEMEIIKLDWDIHNLRIADFNGDGRNDIAIVNNRKAKIEILVQKEAVGAGKAEVAVDAQDVDINLLSPVSRFDRQAVAVSQMVYGLVCGDLNADGMMDLAFYGEPRGLYVILQKAGEGEKGKSATLNWQVRKKIEIDDGLLASDMLVCADLNNDGASDMALAARDAVYIILQKKDGSLSSPVKYPTAGRILAIEAGDLNGDGLIDLVLVMDEVEKPIHVRFGRPSGQLGPEVKFFIEKPSALELADVDGEAGAEVLTVDAESGRLICYKLNSLPSHGSSAGQGKKGTGGSDDWSTLFYPLESGEGDTKRDLVVGDFNGDGLLDVVVSDPGAAELIFYKQVKGTGLDKPVQFPAFADIANLSAADCDYDGKTEVGVLSVKEKIVGISKFVEDRLSFPQPIETAGEPVAMELADINGDGDVDCVYISKDVNDVRDFRVVYNVDSANLPQAAGTDKRGKAGKRKGLDIFGEAEQGSVGLKLEKLSTNPEGIKVVDVDQDGWQDVLIFVKYEKPILVRQSAKGRFEVIDSPAAQMSLIKDASLSSVAVADVDGRAGKELLIAQKNFARSLIFAEGRKWNVVDQYNARGTQDVISAAAAFDIEQSGSAKRPAILLLDGQKGRLEILKAGEDGTYRFEKDLDVGKWDVGAVHLKMLYASLTGGEANSIVLFDGAKFAILTPPSGGAAQRLEKQFDYETEIKDGVYGNLAAGDINGDGRPDIVMVEYRHKHIEILALDERFKPIPAMRFKIFEEKSYQDDKRQGEGRVEPRELRIADVTGDGKADLVSVIHDRIIVYPQD